MSHISSMHCGVPDKLLTNVRPHEKLVEPLASSLAALYDRLLAAKLQKDRVPILVEVSKIYADMQFFFSTIWLYTQIVEVTTAHRPRNFQEYLWYSTFTAALILIQDVPISFCSHKSKIIMHTFQTPTELWDACPIKVHHMHLFEYISIFHF